MPQQVQIVFVVGFARSGTTLLATLLDRHSQMAATPETHFFDEVLPRGARPDTARDAAVLVSSFLGSARVRDLGLTSEDFANLVERRTCSWRDLFSHALAVYAGRHRAPIVVEKTPAHMTKVSQILEWYPDAKVIHILRDGRDAVLSLLRAPWTHSNLRRHARTWRWCVKRMARSQRAHPARIFEVRYEALLAHPDDTLRSVCDFIGVKFEPAQLRPADAQRTVPEWESEWKAKAAAELDPARIQAWKRTATPKQRWIMNSMMGGALRERGYGETSLADCPLPTRVANAFLNAIFLAAYHPAMKPAFAGVKRALKFFGLPTDQIDRPGRADD
ncbi:MAG: sulfotransferase [Candidatus Hydrogenedentes bacterium]|nr:sulfotransferase [Candidatus Hydrogenedentota bacterium]